VQNSGVASPKIWGEAKNVGGAKMFDFRRITLFCLEKRLSKHKMTIFFKDFLGGMALFAPPAYAYCARRRPPKILKVGTAFP